MNNRETFATNLNKLIALSGKQRIDIAADLEVPLTTFLSWSNGVKFPRAEALSKLASYFDVTTADLLLNPNELLDLSNETYEIPVYKSVECGDPTPETDEVIGYINIDASMRRRGEYFAVKAKGDSMFPKIEDGDILIVRKQKNVNSGDVAIVKVNGDDSTCKKIIMRIDGIQLQPLNSNYDTAYYDKKQIESQPVDILGRVVEIRKKL